MIRGLGPILDTSAPEIGPTNNWMIPKGNKVKPVESMSSPNPTGLGSSKRKVKVW